MPVPAAVAIPCLIAANGVTYLLGFFKGKSQAKADIERLTNAVVRYSKIAEEAEKKISLLEQKIKKYEAEIALTRRSRGLLKRLLVFLKGEYPDILLKFSEIEKSRNEINEVKSEVESQGEELGVIYDELKEKYPKQVLKWEKKMQLVK